MIVFGLIGTFGFRKYCPQHEVLQVDIFVLYPENVCKLKKEEKPKSMHSI